MTSWLTYSRVEFLANIAMFIPIGVFFVLLMGRKWWFAAILAGIGVTFTIEFVQLFIPSRVPDIRDLIANSLGASVGVFVALVITWPAAFRDWRASRMARTA
jgi:glycopeptide antibiotics resistance protein